MMRNLHKYFVQICGIGLLLGLSPGARGFLGGATARMGHAIYLVLFAGALSGVGTTDGTGSAARFDYPSGITSDTSGNIYVADSANHTIRKVSPAGVVTTW